MLITRESIISWAVFMIGICLLASMVSGCGSSVGWYAGFGVYPINAVDNNKALIPADKEMRVKQAKY